MYWEIIAIMEEEEAEKEETTTADSFYEAFGRYCSLVMNDECAACNVVTYRNDGNLYGDGKPVLSYDRRS